MPLQFHNSLTGRKEPFAPADPLAVTMYNCGPTVYNFNHLGNFRAYAFVDLLRRYIKYRGYGLEQTINITDVDDKIIDTARKSGQKIDDFTAPYIQAYLDDLEYLGIEDVEHRPRATRHIPAMLEMIQSLDKSGHTYVQDGNVYFRLASFADYGRLSGIDPEQLRTAADGRFAADEYEKENARDFALWKAPQNEAEESWESPYGPGRPGWHLECSAMIREIYGSRGVDIHTGGIDLLFPHHENEIAQSVCAHPGDKFVSLWMHNEHLLVDGQKMAKSVGNFFTLRDFSERDRLNALVKEKGAPDGLIKLYERGYLQRCLRYVLISTHYRQKLNFSFTAIVGAESSLKRLQNTIERLKQHAKWQGEDIQAAIAGADPEATEPGASPGAPRADASDKSIHLARQRFIEALDDDLNVAKALAALFDLCRDINNEIEERDPQYARDALTFLARANSVLNIFDFSENSADQATAGVDNELAAQVEQAIIDRREAKARKDFTEADRIRDSLKSEGIVLKDGPTGETTWEKI